MAMTGTYDFGSQGQSSLWRKDSFNNSPPGDKYFVFIEGANHYSFTGVWAERDGAGGGIRGLMNAQRVSAAEQKAIFEWVKIASIAFWDAYLKNDAAARAYVNSEGLQTFSRKAVAITKK
jgi:hypothetical protein